MDCKHCGSADAQNDGEHFVFGTGVTCLNGKDSRRG